MPCAVCAEWIPSESVTYSFHHVGDEIALYTLGGNLHRTVSALDRNEIANALRVRDYRITVHESRMVIQVCGEWMRWRICERFPPPMCFQTESMVHCSGDIDAYTILSEHRAVGNTLPWAMYNGTIHAAAYFFVCESCRDAGRYHDPYSNINIAGSDSTASSSDPGNS